MKDPMELEQIERAVLAQELAWTAAHQELDLEALRRILSDQFIKLTDEGELLGKSELLASYQGGDRHWELAESSDHQIRIAGECAFLSGRWRARGINGGHPFDYSARFLAIYVLEGDNWRMISEHSVPLE